MRKFLLSIIMFSAIMLSAYAEKMPNLQYKNIANKERIYYNPSTDLWSKKSDKSDNYFIKTKGFGDFYDYLTPSKDFAFSTSCEYEFIYNGRLIGYSNKDLKFYEIMYENGNIEKIPLQLDEVQEILHGYRVISISEFSEKTNSIKIKKSHRDLKIFLYNDTDKTFDDFDFSSGNAKFEQYSLRGFLTVSKPGMIQFSGRGDDNRNRWYVILVR